jgi:hypothetical protein
MNAVIALQAGAGLAWLGAAVLTVADARRGLALGLALASIGLATTAFVNGQSLAAAALLAGGLGTASCRIRDGKAGWALVPAGSTPRLVLCLLVLLGALVLKTSVTSISLMQLTMFTVGCLAVARLLTASSRSVVLAAAALLVLGLAAGGSVQVAVAAAAVAIVLGTIPARPVDATS